MEQIKDYNFKLINSLSYGENTHQQAALYDYSRVIDWSLIQGLELKYVDILNSSVALETAAEFFDVAAVIIVNHANPTSAALGSDVNVAWDKAFDTNPISAFNSTVALSREVSAISAKKLLDVSPEIVLAPSFCPKSLEILSRNKNIKLIQINTKLENILNFTPEEIKITPFGALIQTKDKKDLDVSSFKVVTKRKPEQKEVEDMIFAFKVAKHVKSAAAVVAKDLRTLSISSARPNGADSIEIALDRVCDSPKDTIIALDGSFSSLNTLYAAVQNRVSGIIQPMGTVKDKELIDYANKMNISMIATGIAHLKH